jgi:hypothetical protein
MSIVIVAGVERFPASSTCPHLVHKRLKKLRAGFAIRDYALRRLLRPP